MTAEISGFSLYRRNTVSDDTDVISSGRLFHSLVRSAEANDRSPM